VGLVDKALKILTNNYNITVLKFSTYDRTSNVQQVEMTFVSISVRARTLDE